MDEIVKKLASFGLPGVILVVMLAVSGAERHVAIPLILATLGGPFGMLGGLTVLGIVTLVGDYLAGYGIEALLTAVYKERSKEEPLSGIFKEIRELPISDELKHNLRSNITNSDKSESASTIPAIGPQTEEI
ncbi:hypothetical protein VB620_11895 [Nodularia harveyana UHCC-0300]|uniref:Uncharacterized protein n=1 Tax=Nodularia harveyana UHCC-0300 TaxID=2974287 RepID=A0ABU5UES8_9CYAN|nr:hypothetical protein [Nodularia harveyana]MEA5582042.1 hypothetical protein [Nodularia harveyana UHCC-0300]